MATSKTKPDTRWTVEDWLFLTVLVSFNMGAAWFLLSLPFFPERVRSPDADLLLFLWVASVLSALVGTSCARDLAVIIKRQNLAARAARAMLGNFVVSDGQHRPKGDRGMRAKSRAYAPGYMLSPLRGHKEGTVTRSL